jgi:hypothetical protein
MPRRRIQEQPEEPKSTAALVEEIKAKSPVIRYTLEESRRQLAFVEDLIVQGASIGQIIRLARKPKNSGGLDIGEKRTRKLIERVKETHAREDAEARQEWKAAQIRRLHEYRRQASGVRNPDGTWKVEPDHKAIIAYERLLAQICGTLEPVELKVDARYTEAMLTVVGTLTNEDAAALLAEAREQAALAEKARKLLPAIVVADVPDSAESGGSHHAAE